MTIQKSHWDTEGENVRLSMPFSKVDKERRIVSGFATLDNIDKQSDIVTTEASLAAFKKFRGNIREMHQPIPVGKMISFKEDRYFDPETKKFYSGVYVSTYISKGAQDTWEKVLDGTLSGFSIGGRMNKWDDAIDTTTDKAIRIIKDYDLFELSLVDTPANQLANVLSIEKVDGVNVVKGDVVDTNIENVFWDKEDGIVLLSENEVEISPTSGAPMQNIGFVEKTDNEKATLIKFLIDSAKGINTVEINKEANMSETTEAPAEAVAVEEVHVAPEADTTDEVVEEVAAEEIEKAAMPSDEPADPALDAEEDATEPTDDELTAPSKVALNDNTQATVVSKSDEVVAESIAELKDTITSAFSDITAVVKSLSEEVAALKKSNDFANAKLADAESAFNEFGKRVDAVEADTAFRKSGDLGEIVQEQPETQVEKSLWGGRFLKTADLLN